MTWTDKNSLELSGYRSLGRAALLAAFFLVGGAWLSGQQSPTVRAVNFNWSATLQVPVSAPRVATVSIAPASFSVIGRSSQPVARTGVPVRVGSGANAETVTPIWSDCNNTEAASCSLRAAFMNTHASGETIASASNGLEEAIQYQHEHGGGAVEITDTWGTGPLPAVAGFTAVPILDLRDGGWSWYRWNGSVYSSALSLSASGATAAAWRSLSPNITPNSIEGVVYADQMGSLAAAVQALPSQGGTVQLACGSGQTNSYSVPLIIVTGATRLLGCGHDESGDGSHLVFSPPSSWSAYAWQPHQAYAAAAFIVDPNGNLEVIGSGGDGTSGSAEPAWPTSIGAQTTDGTLLWTNCGPPAAIVALNAYGLTLSQFSLSQGNSVPGVGGLALLGVHDADLRNFYVGASVAGESDFTGTGLLLAATAYASSIYNNFENFTITGGEYACELMSANPGKVVNANDFIRGTCGNASQINLDLTGAGPGTGGVSENTFLNLDVSGNAAPVQVQVGNNASGGTFRGNVLDLTEESDVSAPAGQIGILNRGALTQVYSEGALGGANPVYIEDAAGGTHRYCRGAATPACESTVFPLEYDASGDFGFATAPGTGGNSFNFPSGFAVNVGGAPLADLTGNGLELKRSGGTWLADGSSGTLRIGASAGTADGSVAASTASFSGAVSSASLALTPGTVAALPACTAAIAGHLAAVSDANVSTWGSVPSGGGSANVLLYCDGSQWSVIGK